MKSSRKSSKATHKQASARERLDALRQEFRGLYKAAERTGSTVGRIEEIMGEIAAIQEEQYGSKAMEGGAKDGA